MSFGVKLNDPTLDRRVPMEFVALVALLILCEYIVFMALCGKARADSGLLAPATTGDESFERAYRVQMNTLEQMVITLPAMWLCAYFFMPIVAGVLGLSFFVGRLVYRATYIKDPATRGPGMIIGFLSNVLLLLCGLWGVLTPL
ncbi:MAG: glutathione S-transferase [Halieaceae bacterium]|jgi:glutathione S-transferase